MLTVLLMHSDLCMLRVNVDREMCDFVYILQSIVIDCNRLQSTVINEGFHEQLPLHHDPMSASSTWKAWT